MAAELTCEEVGCLCVIPRVYVVHEISLGFVPGPPRRQKAPKKHEGKRHRWQMVMRRWVCLDCPARKPPANTPMPPCQPAPKGGA